MEKMFFAGVDWATEANEVCLVGSTGEVISTGQFANSGPGVQELADWLLMKSGTRPDNIFIAIEVPHGIVAEGLLERDFQVYSINPKQADRFRDRFSVPGAKDDRLDARVLGDSLRTDRHCFRKVSADPAAIIRLRGYSRHYEDLQELRNGLCNRMREQLRRYYPAFLRLGDIDAKWALDLWKKAPTPASAKRLRKRTLEAILKKNRIRRFQVEDVKTILGEAAPVVIPGTTEAARASIELLIPQLQLVNDQLKHCRQQMESLLEGDEETEMEGRTGQQKDATLIQTMPGVGIRITSTLLAEGGHALQQRDYHRLRSLGGSAPITKRSGKKVVVVMRRACNPRLRNALHIMAQGAMMHDAHWNAVYADLRAKGKSYGCALRCVADRMLRVMCAMLEAQTAYDPLRLGAAAKHAA